MYGNWLYFLTPDCHLVSLNIKDGKERWHKTDLRSRPVSTTAPWRRWSSRITSSPASAATISTVPGYIESHDPETGDLQWRWYTVPQKKGDPGSETWPNEEAMKHGGGMTWQSADLRSRAEPALRHAPAIRSP